MIVAGYAGNDSSIMSVLLSLSEGATAFTGGIYWLLLQGHGPSQHAMRLIEATIARGSGFIEVLDADTFFGDLLQELPPTGKPKFPSLPDAAWKPFDTSTCMREFISQRLDHLSTEELMVLIDRHPDFSSLARMPASLDYLLSRYEELQELPRNVGETVNRYVDLLAHRIAKPVPREQFPPHVQREIEMVDLGLADATAQGVCVHGDLFRGYLGGLRLKESQLDYANLKTMLQEDSTYESLRNYVGLIPDATAVIDATFRQSMDSPGLYGRSRPWNMEFLRVAELVGAAAYINDALVSRIADLLLLEFDSERWFPEGAIRALAAMGSRIVDQLLEYILDSKQDTFSREDGALVLGAIGTRRAVEAIGAVAGHQTPRNAKMLVYALGHTRNPRAVDVVRSLACRVSPAYDSVVQEALGRLQHHDDTVRATGPSEEPSLRPDLDRAQVVSEFCPALPSDAMARQFYSLYVEHGPALVHALQTMPPSDIKMLATAGRRLREAGKLWEAEAVVTECLERYPFVHHVCHDLAIIYSRMGRLTAARRYYTLGICLNPDYPEYFNDFAVIMMRLGNLEAARYLLMVALSLDSENYLPWFNLGMLSLGRPESESQQIPTASGGVIHMFTVASGSVVDKHEASICLRRVLALKPDHLVAAKTLEALFPLPEQPPQGLPSRAELLSVLHLGELIIPEGITEQGLSAVVRVAAERAGKAFRNQQWQEALEAIDQAINEAPRVTGFRQNKSIILAQMKRWDAAISTCEDGLEMAPWDQELLVNYAFLLCRAGRYKDAVKAATKAVQSSPTSPASWISLAKAYHAGGRNTEAAEVLQHAISISPPWSWPLGQVGELVKDLGLDALLVW